MYGSIHGWSNRLWRFIRCMHIQPTSCSSKVHRERSCAQLGKVSFHGFIWHCSGAHCFWTRNWGWSIQNWAHFKVAAPKDCEGHSFFSWACQILSEVHTKFFNYISTTMQPLRKGSHVWLDTTMSGRISFSRRQADFCPHHLATWLELTIWDYVWRK